MVDEYAADGWPDEEAGLYDHRVQCHSVHQNSRRHESWDQSRAGRPIEDFDECSKKAKNINVPDLDGPGKGKQTQDHAGNQLKHHTRKYELCSIAVVSPGTGRWAKDDKGQRLQKTSETKL